MLLREKQKRPKVLLNPSNISEFHRKNLFMELVRATQKLSIKRFDMVIGPLLKDPRMQAVLPFYNKTLEEISEAKHYDLSGIERTLAYYYQIIKTQSSKVNEFIKEKNKFEKLLFSGDHASCEYFLEDHKLKFGESIWWIKANLLVLFFKQNSDDTQKFCDQILDRAGNSLFTYYLNSLIQCTHASSPMRELERKISKAQEEFEKAGIPTISWFVTKLCFPEIITQRAEDLENLSLLQKLPVVDIYHFTTSAVLFHLKSSATSKEKSIPCKKFISQLCKVVNDEVLNTYNLGKNHNPSSPPSLESELLKKYKSGKHEELLSAFTSQIENIIHPISFSNIIAKSCLITKKSFYSGRPILDETVKNLIDIHSLSTKSSQARLDIQERIVRLHGTELGVQLQAVLALAMPQFFPEAPLINILQVAELTQRTTPPLAQGTIENGKQIYGETFHHMAYEALPIECTDIKKDKIEHHFRMLISNKKLDKCIEYASKCLTEYPESYICFPMDVLLRHIESQFINTLEAIIVCHFYVRFISSEKRTLLNEIFEEHLHSLGLTKPSELFSKLKEAQDKKLELLFLNEICSFEALDFLDSFQSSDELRAERASIIDHLYNQKLISKESYSKELEQIVRLIVMDSATSNFSRSKIYVDHNSIKRKIREEASTYFDLFKITKSTESSTNDGIFTLSDRTSTDNTFTSALVSGQHNSLLVKIIEVTHRAFLFDEAFGLDANLSSEIRHGIFSNFMLSEVDKKHLISEKNDDGTYKPIQYWHDFYSSWIVPSLLKELDREFAWFSEKYNALIDTAEQWMKIGDDKGEQCLNFAINLDDYEEIKATATRSESVDEVIDALLTMLWVKTEIGLDDIKDRINSIFKHDIETLFAELTRRLTFIKGNAVLNEIMTNIESANNNTKEIIAEITEWFVRSENKSFDDQSLSQLIDISISCFERIKGRNLNIYQKLPADVAIVQIPGTYVNSMILAIVNLLSNAIRHSGQELNTSIKISGTAQPMGYKINISNTLSETRQSELGDNFFNEVNRKLNSPGSLELMRSEGGTGLAKAYHHLKCAHPGFDLKVMFSKNQFCTEVTYAPVPAAG